MAPNGGSVLTSNPYYPTPFTATNDAPSLRVGIFGRVNISTTFAEISDGLSKTIATGELQRLYKMSAPTINSQDGWAIGGDPTLFTTGVMATWVRDATTGLYNSGPVTVDGMMMNNYYFGSPGSMHPKGANFGMADGSVHFISDTSDARIFALMGSMADNQPIDTHL